MAGFKPTREMLLDNQGRPLTQALFLELGYNTEFAVYTLKDWDHEYNGKLYPSLKQLYTQFEDVIEYDFANTYLLGWKHWQRICNNKALTPYVEEWRLELEMKLRSQAVKDIIDMTADEKSFQAKKWIVDKGWDKRPAGRPSAKNKETEAAFVRKVQDDYGDDIARLTKG